MTPGEELVLKTLRQTTLASLSANDFAAIEKAVEENGIRNLTGLAKRVVETAVAKHGSHDQSSHGSWARGGGMGGGAARGKTNQAARAKTQNKYNDKFNSIVAEADKKGDNDLIAEANEVDTAWQTKDIDTLNDFKSGSRNSSVRTLARNALADIKAQDPDNFERLEFES
jgi:hypothetical protein